MGEVAVPMLVQVPREVLNVRPEYRRRHVAFKSSPLGIELPRRAVHVGDVERSSWCHAEGKRADFFKGVEDRPSIWKAGEPQKSVLTQRLTSPLRRLVVVEVPPQIVAGVHELPDRPAQVTVVFVDPLTLRPMRARHLGDVHAEVEAEGAVEALTEARHLRPGRRFFRCHPEVDDVDDAGPPLVC